MTTAEILHELRHMTTSERLVVLEGTMNMIRDDLNSHHTPTSERESKLRSAAIALKDLYEPGGELTEWTCLDAEEFCDDHVER